MKLRTSLNALAAASVLAMALMTLPPDLAHAADNSPKPSAQQNCESRGFAWIQGKCADKACPPAGLPAAPGEPGEVRRLDVGRPLKTLIMCDGLEGRWVVIADVRPGTSGGPGAPPPTASR